LNFKPLSPSPPPPPTPDAPTAEGDFGFGVVSGRNIPTGCSKSDIGEFSFFETLLAQYGA
jgi:hypothetical protein